MAIDAGRLTHSLPDSISEYGDQWRNFWQC